jgi:hypothetical protein
MSSPPTAAPCQRQVAPRKIRWAERRTMRTASALSSAVRYRQLRLARSPGESDPGGPRRNRLAGADCLPSCARRPRYGYHLHQLIQSDEVVGVGGMKRKPIGGRDRSDHQVRDAATRCAPGGQDGRAHHAVRAGRFGVEGQRVEGRLGVLQHAGAPSPLDGPDRVPPDERQCSCRSGRA